MFNFLKRFFGAYTAYQPGTGRIIPVQLNSTTGININEVTSLSIPAFLHGVRLISQTIGSRHFDLIHHLPNNAGEEIARTHPVHRLLHDEPNELQTPGDFKTTLTAHAIIYGNGYAYIERNGNYRPTALLPLLPDRTRAVLDRGAYHYETIVDNNTISLQPYEVFHIKGFGINALSGLPLVQLMRDTLGLSKAQEEFAAKFFGCGANMGGIVTVPGSLSDNARQNLKSSMEREYGGLGNAFRTLFLEDGVKYEKMGVEPDKAQFIEGRQFALADMARVIGLAPHLLFDLSRSTNNNIEHQGIEAVTYCFGPWALKLEQEANRKLLYASEKDEYECRIDLKPLMLGDALSQAQRDQLRFNSLALTPNEIRAKDGLNPISGGDVLYINTAYLPLDVAVAKALQPAAPAQAVPDVAEATDDSTDDSPPALPGAGDVPSDGPAVDSKYVADDLGRSILTPLAQDAIARILRREEKAIENARKKFTDAGDFTRWYDGWEKEQRQHITEVLAPLGQAMDRCGLKLNGYAEHHLKQSRDSLATPINEGERLAQAVNQILGESNARK